jgi:PPOX class probable F420-dependent enzyme
MAAARRRATLHWRPARRVTGQLIEQEGTKMTLTQETRELGRRQPLSVPGKYLSLTTYRRDGTPVSTPVWFVEEHGRLFVITAAHSYKAKRLRRNPAAMVAPCTARGVPQGDPIPVEVEFLPQEEDARVDRLIAEKYRVDRVLILPIYRLVMKLRGKPIDNGGDAYLAITST